MEDNKKLCKSKFICRPLVVLVRVSGFMCSALKLKTSQKDECACKKEVWGGANLLPVAKKIFNKSSRAGFQQLGTRWWRHRARIHRKKFYARLRVEAKNGVWWCMYGAVMAYLIYGRLSKFGRTDSGSGERIRTLGITIYRAGDATYIISERFSGCIWDELIHVNCVQQFAFVKN